MVSPLLPQRPDTGVKGYVIAWASELDSSVALRLHWKDERSACPPSPHGLTMGSRAV